MTSIVFLSTHPERGEVHATGPVTGMEYTIGPSGTPVAKVDEAGLLATLEDPCCGRPLPLGGKVKVFHRMVPSGAQVASVPQDFLVQVNLATIRTVIPSKDPVEPPKPKRQRPRKKKKVEAE